MKEKEPLIRIKDLHKDFGDEEEGVIHALRGANLEVFKGDFLAIMGPSGCGKSTLLYCLGGMDTVSSGEIYLGDTPIHNLKASQLTEIRRKQMAMVFQSHNLIPSLSLLENTMLAGMVCGKSRKESTERAKELLDMVKLGSRIHHSVKKLSGGEQQRGTLARALMNNPSIILADEPTGSLDSETSDEVVSLLENFSKENGITILMVTHSKDLAKRAGHIVHMKDGKVLL